MAAQSEGGGYRMRRYEVMVILDPDLEERTVAPVARHSTSTSSATTAAPSRRSTSGAVAGSPTRSTRSPKASTPSSTLNAEPATVKELDRQLTLNESVLRTKVIRPDTRLSHSTEQATTGPSDRSLHMAGETIITVIGNLTDDPELRFTPSGAAVANFTVASTPRSSTGRPTSGRTASRCSSAAAVWRQAAENVAESLQRGMRVIVTGPLRRARTRQRGREAHASSRSTSTRSARA